MSRAQLGLQFLQFTGVGAIGTLVHFAVLVTLTELGLCGPVAASCAGAFFGAITNYVLNYVYTFQSKEPHNRALSKFLLVAGTGFLINMGLMSLFVTVLGVHYLLAQVATTGLVLLWTFSLNRAWTFAR